MTDRSNVAPPAKNSKKSLCQTFPFGLQTSEVSASLANDMEEIQFHYNKNEIYVLDTSYTQEFDRLSLVDLSGNKALLTHKTNSEYERSWPTEEHTSTELKPIKLQNAPLTAISRIFHCSREARQPIKKDQINSSTSSFSIATKKKTSTIKSTIIAKKTKFWKYLEEEKSRENNCDDISSTNCPRSCAKIAENGSNDNDKNDISKINEITSHEESTTELYEEAAKLLGLSCTLCNNCRCLDCQAHYFDCDDSDNFSDDSFRGDWCDIITERQRLYKQRSFQKFTSSNSTLSD